MSEIVRFRVSIDSFGGFWLKLVVMFSRKVLVSLSGAMEIGILNRVNFAISFAG